MSRRNNYVAVINFKQSSYEVMEDRGEVTIMVELSRQSSQPFQVMISLMDVTANCKYGIILAILYNY